MAKTESSAPALNNEGIKSDQKRQTAIHIVCRDCDTNDHRIGQYRTLETLITKPHRVGEDLETDARLLVDDHRGHTGHQNIVTREVVVE